MWVWAVGVRGVEDADLWDGGVCGLRSAGFVVLVVAAWLDELW